MKQLRNSLIVLSVFCSLCIYLAIVTRTEASRFSSSTQQDGTQLSRDLTTSFKQSNLLRFDAASVNKQVRKNGRLSFVVDGKTWDLVLTPNDMRAANYRAEKTVDGGARASVDIGEVKTFKGFIVGLSKTDVRLTIDDETIEGVIFTDEGRYYIEPARRYTNAASKSDFVFYSEKNVISREIGDCGVTLHDTVEQATTTYMPKLPQSLTVLKVAEIATEADYDYVAALGSASAANNQILSTLNQVDAVYRRDLNITLRVVYQHTWDTASDPYSGTVPSTMLVQFRDHWNANFTGVSRDVAHMWTGRDMDGGTVGIAYVGVICRAPTSSYGVTQKFDIEPAKFSITAHELGHNFSGSHSDGQTGCNNTIMQSSITNNPPTFCQFSRDQVATHTNTYPSCLSNVFSGAVKTRFDYDGDGRADLTVYRPNGGTWYTLQSGNGSFNTVQFGIQEDKPVPEDFDGDGKADIAVWRPSSGTWYILNSNNSTLSIYNFGINADIPAPADYDGDGKADVALFRPSNGVWYFLYSRDGFGARNFGINGDIPAAGDFDGDGKADINLFRPTEGNWYALRSGNGSLGVVRFGINEDKPIAADFDGDGKADQGIYRPNASTWYIFLSANSSVRITQFGSQTDQPAAADYDGDGKTDIGVFRPSSGTWYFLYSSNGGLDVRQFGTNGDISAPSAYIR